MRRFIARRALRRVNEIRQSLSLEPIEVLPVGDRTQAGSCVLANALPGGNVASRIEVKGKSYKHSFWSMIFIRMFDFGLYPVFNSNSLLLSTSEGKRRRMCETRFQTVQRKRAEKRDKASEEIVTQLRASEEATFKLRQRVESLSASLTEVRQSSELALEAERKISDRLETRLADQRRESAQRIAELNHESVSDSKPKVEPLVEDWPEVEPQPIS